MLFLLPEREENKECDTVVAGEGGETGEFPANTSVVFATLEVCLCALVRHVPALNPGEGGSGFQPPTHLARLGSDTFELLARVMKIMISLLDLCSATGQL